jgi:hypothetical protein
LKKNHADFLCYVIKSIYQSLDNEILSKLKINAMTIGDKQIYDSKNNNITVYKSIQQQYNDKLNRLPSIIIDNIGSFLQQFQSIEF